MKKAALIYNPYAGNHQFEHSLNEVLHRFQQAGIEVNPYKTEYEGHGKELAAQCGRNVDMVIAAGGDGTVHEVANGLSGLEKRPFFGIIPAGTANDFCRGLGIPLDINKACDVILKGNVKKIDVGKYDKGDFFLNFWGIGLITDISENVELKNKTFLGKFAYYMSTVQNLNDVSSFQCRIEADSYTYEGEAVLIIIANGPSIGGLQLFFPDADMEDGLFNILICKNTTLSQLTAIIQSKLSGQPLEHEDVMYVKAKRIFVDTIGPQLIDCDGEKAHHTPSTIEVLPRHLTVFIPGS